MNKYLVSFVSLLVGLGLGYPLFHNGAKPVSEPAPLGGLYNYNKTQFINGFSAGTTEQFAVNSSGAVTASGAQTITGNVTASGDASALHYNTASVGSSSSSPAALGSATAGHFIVAAGATTANASTTAVTANSSVIVQLEKSTPIAGTTCNTTVNSSSTPAAVQTVTGNGFIVTVPSAPVTNPFCFSYYVIN